MDKRLISENLAAISPNPEQECPDPGLEQAISQQEPSHFNDMPLEVFYEVARRLEPLSLLFLSRTNKQLRSLLMGRRAAPFWRSAVERDPDLPPLPKDLLDPQYVALLLTDECSVCGNSTHYTINFVLLTRLCGTCRRKKTINLECVKYFWLVYSSPQLAPPDKGNRKCSSWCLHSEVGFVNRKMKDFKRLDGSPNPDCASWIRERRNSIVERRKAGQEISNWIARRKQERGKESN